MKPPYYFLLLLLVLSGETSAGAGETSAVGDPGMAGEGLRVAVEAWNFCNEVGAEAPGMGSPRRAFCYDYTGGEMVPKVRQEDNLLGVGMDFQGLSREARTDVDLYAVEKERYLGSLCEVVEGEKRWNFWTIMVKNGNFETGLGICPENGKRVGGFEERGRFPCAEPGCMNQPAMRGEETRVRGEGGARRGGFNGSYELEDGGEGGVGGRASYFEVVWEKKKVGGGGWVFYHTLKTSVKYPWLMLYLRADASRGFSGGYPHDSRGMLKSLPKSPNFKVKLTLNVTKGGGAKSQFYLTDIGGCWKDDGSSCDGDVLTDVTRYSEMIINPETEAWCSPSALANCPPYHTAPNYTRIPRTDANNFPYDAYHYYCVHPTAKHRELPCSTCDPYSNPQAQEILQLLPHPAWATYGYPSAKGEGWVGDPRTWDLDLGGLSNRLYFYQDPNTTRAERIWGSINVGTEIFVSKKDEVAEWSVSDFDVILTSKKNHPT